MTLYLKYRSQTLDELDLESVRTNLKEIVLSGNIPHAFLFSGPKGTGKTSAARILAKIVNCENLGKDGEPCNKCSSCLSITKGNNIDIIELDAASNRGIDDIRNLKEGIYLSPTSAKKKVYIIDEAHMLTLEAANAFLKTLEEPPDHAVFILATTNPEKLPETVISRLTQVNFTKATDADISRQLNRVAKGEEIKITPGAIKNISKLADGSFRDAIKILENLSFKTKDIKEDDLENYLPALAKNVDEFSKILSEKNIQKVLEFIENLVTNGISIKTFTTKLITKIHEEILAKNGIGESSLPDFDSKDLILLNELIGNSRNDNGPIIQLPLEIAVVKFLSKNETPQETPSEISSPAKPVETKKKPILLNTSTMDDENWAKLLLNIREKNVSLEALLRAAKPLGYDGKDLVLGVYYQFHKEHLEDVKNLQLLENICKESLGLDSIKITYELIDRPAKKEEVAQTQTANPEPDLKTAVDTDIIDAAKEIFG